jgi:hypothetical protein
LEGETFTFREGLTKEDIICSKLNIISKRLSVQSLKKRRRNQEEVFGKLLNYSFLWGDYFTKFLSSFLPSKRANAISVPLALI